MFVFGTRDLEKLIRTSFYDECLVRSTNDIWRERARVCARIIGSKASRARRCSSGATPLTRYETRNFQAFRRW